MIGVSSFCTGLHYKQCSLPSFKCMTIITDPARRLSSFDTSYRSVLPSAVTRPRGPRPRQGCATSCLNEANYSIECRVGYYSHRFGRRKGTLVAWIVLLLLIHLSSYSIQFDSSPEVLGGTGQYVFVGVIGLKRIRASDDHIRV